MQPIVVLWSSALHNFDRVLTKFNSVNGCFTEFKFPSLMQFKSYRLSIEVLFAIIVLCIIDKHSTGLLCSMLC